MSVIVHKLPPLGFISVAVLIISKKPHKITVVMVFITASRLSDGIPLRMHPDTGPLSRSTHDHGRLLSTLRAALTWAWTVH